MKISLDCNCDCWNEGPIQTFADDITEQEQKAQQAGLKVGEGLVACEGQSDHGHGLVCGAYIVYSTVEFVGLRASYKFDRGPATASRIPGFEHMEPEQRSLL